VHRVKAGLGLKPDYEGMWPLPTFAHRMLRFYASTKDPSLVDEREVRIMAVPAKEPIARPFTGILAVKPVKTMSDGRDYIDVGAGWLPGIEPKRIIIDDINRGPGTGHPFLGFAGPSRRPKPCGCNRARARQSRLIEICP
jgi:hypothetical protein